MTANTYLSPNATLERILGEHTRWGVDSCSCGGQAALAGSSFSSHVARAIRKELEFQPVATSTGGMLFFAPGKPIPQGSKRRSRYGAMYEAAKALKPWRRTVTLAAIGARRKGFRIYDGPVRVTIDFVFESKTKRSRWKTTKPDVDKLARAVLDSITDAAIWHDDSQVVELITRKQWSSDVHSKPGALVRIEHLADEGRP